MLSRTASHALGYSTSMARRSSLLPPPSIRQHGTLQKFRPTNRFQSAENNTTRRNNNNNFSSSRYENQSPQSQTYNHHHRRFFSSDPTSTNTTTTTTPEQIAAHIAKLSQQPGALEELTNSLSPGMRQELVHSVLVLLGRSGNPAAAAAAAATEHVPEPSKEDLRALILTTSIPFVGFGIMDNAILIIAGDAIDTSLGVLLGISTMCAAAIGNIISDVAGIMLGTVVEDFCAKYLLLPTPDLTTAQRQLRSVRWANQFGCGLGIVIGCIIGMFPLLFIDSHKIQALKREAHMDSIFKDVITEAKKLVSAQDTHLYLIVDNKETKHPTADGKFLYAKYDVKTNNVDRFFPLGRGIVSRAALTGEAWNFYDVRSEPDYVPELYDVSADIRSMVCVPVMDANGRAIAVLQAINKQLPPGQQPPRQEQLPGTEARIGFTQSDVQVLKALASHIGVALQRMYGEQADNEEMRLKDTITMLREYGLEGIDGVGRRKLLFPEG